MYSLHMIPTKYQLDGQNVDEPLDMNGSRLDVWLQTVAFPMTYVQNVVSCVRGAGLEVKGLVLKPLAGSLGAVYEEEMRAGCISICIGGGTTGIVLYQGGRAFRIMSIPIGGEHVSRDLAMVLHLTLREAELLKRRMFIDSEEELRRQGIDVETAYQVVFARLEELFDEYVRNALAECTPQNYPGGIILSGGVSDTPGIEMMLADILQMPVRKATEPIYSMPPGLDNAAYVSSAGILKYFAVTEGDPYMFIKSNQPLPGLAVQSGDDDEQAKKPKKRRSLFGDEEDEEQDDSEEPQNEPENSEDSDNGDDGNDEDDEPHENLADKFKNFMRQVGKMF